MNTRLFDNGYVGIKLTSVSDIMKYNALKNQFSICDDNEYYFDEYVTDMDEDGNETEREPNENEKLERILDSFKNGSILYATFWLDCGEVFPRAGTTLQNTFYVGQEVFTMEDNKIVRAKVDYLSLASGDIKDNARLKGASLKESAQRLYYRIGNMFKNGVESPSWQNLDDIINLLKGFVVSNFAIISTVNGETKKKSFDELFVTKEELIKHLMEESV